MATKKKAKKTAKKARAPREVIDLKARDALSLVGHAFTALHGLETEAQTRVDAAAAACRQLKS